MKTETRHVTISQEYLNKIRQFTAIRPDEHFIYIPKAYRELPEELQPKFTMRPITGEEGLRYADSMRGEVLIDGGKAQIQVKHGQYTISVVKCGLIQWDNYYDANGNIVEYKQGSIENLPRVLIEELSEVITSGSKLEEEEILGLKS